jgi:hypothetical protein
MHDQHDVHHHDAHELAQLTIIPCAANHASDVTSLFGLLRLKSSMVLSVEVKVEAVK